MNFHEVRFPVSISFGSSGSVERRTEIVRLSSGFEERNTPWARSRRRYDAGLGVRSLADLETVTGFFEARLGQLYGFRWKDWLDHKSCAVGETVAMTDQAIGTGDGVETAFQLVKAYGGVSRPVSKPVAGTVVVAIDGVQAGVSVDETTGIVSFGAPPPAGAAITAGFEFDVPVRFDSAEIEYSITAFNAGSVPSIPIVEVRL